MHEVAITALLSLRPGMQRLKFKQALMRAMAPEVDQGYFKAALGDFHRRPDAYHIDASCGRVTVYEVEDTSPISAEKMRDYVDLFWFLDEERWTLEIVTADRMGRQTGVVDPLAWSITDAMTDSGEIPPMPVEFVAQQTRAAMRIDDPRNGPCSPARYRVLD